jgi:hypothetical protein
MIDKTLIILICFLIFSIIIFVRRNNKIKRMIKLKALYDLCEIPKGRNR